VGASGDTLDLFLPLFLDLMQHNILNDVKK
jgi:hypothetical protein